MRNKWLCLSAFVLVGLAVAIPLHDSRAQGVAPDQQVTQAELAKLMVRILNLNRSVPGEYTVTEAIAICLKNRISPDGGWKPGEVVTRAVLARVIVQALGLADKVQNPEDPKAWIDLLTEMNIPIATVGQAVGNLSPSAIPVGPGPGAATVDPLKTPIFVSAEDALQDGADVSDPSSIRRPIITLQDVQKVVAAIVIPPPRRVVTPD